MPTTTGYEFGDIVLVPFPFTDQSTSKQRPAVVISSAAYQRERPDLIILAVTSQVRPAATVGVVNPSPSPRASQTCFGPPLGQLGRRFVSREMVVRSGPCHCGQSCGRGL